MKQPSSYRDILSEVLKAREREGRTYSVRAFARDLKMQPAHLYDVMSGRRGISVKTAQQIVSQLKFDADKAELFFDLVKSEHARDLKTKHEAQERIQQKLKRIKVEKLQDEELDLLVSWVRPAILELVSVSKGKIDAATCARRLRISEREAELALDALVRMRLLRRDRSGLFGRETKHVSVQAASPAKRYRDFHKQLALLSNERIESQPMETRKHRSMIFSFNSSRIEEARKFIEEMHLEFLERFQTNSDEDSVYAFSQFFFRVDEV